ncbi:hypothetical protein [Heliophilum fasciatum]|uniref:Uncharacterized protein n=1 Tax=Heliophilum fasciatum TaxID=35700 RepID=A0A4R2RUX2_9FIRM|nr:hypothetical protein [Heliophilum fasciatum]MCW2277358.1 hypothetical protein [Heliophilum fasciatum]TCP67194.1 hypothetical protein EDD73_10589 [Heliophilum fasciatum]
MKGWRRYGLYALLLLLLTGFLWGSWSLGWRVAVEVPKEERPSGQPMRVDRSLAELWRDWRD